MARTTKVTRTGTAAATTVRFRENRPSFRVIFFSRKEPWERSRGTRASLSLSSGDLRHFLVDGAGEIDHETHDGETMGSVTHDELYAVREERGIHAYVYVCVCVRTYVHVFRTARAYVYQRAVQSSRSHTHARARLYVTSNANGGNKKQKDRARTRNTGHPRSSLRTFALQHRRAKIQANHRRIASSEETVKERRPD